MKEMKLFDFIGRQKLAVLATVDPDGSPQAALVGIAVTPQLEIVLDTVDSSRKYRNLMASPAASFVVGWEDEITLQYQGRAAALESDELERYKEVYFARWPDGRDRQSWPGIAYFVVRPEWIRYCDYDQRPPLIEEFVFSPTHT